MARWGDEVAPDGRVDRAAVARRAFATDEDRGWLEGLLWPKVGQRVAEWRAIESQKHPRALVVETPLLFEAGLESNYDATIAVSPTRRCAPSAPAHAGTRPSTNGQHGS